MIEDSMLLTPPEARHPRHQHVRWEYPQAPERTYSHSHIPPPQGTECVPPENHPTIPKMQHVTYTMGGGRRTQRGHSCTPTINKHTSKEGKKLTEWATAKARRRIFRCDTDGTFFVCFMGRPLWTFGNLARENNVLADIPPFCFPE